ncbi:MAG: 2Fe-2S iron-sulfur cluster binding domain-containing protein, partial [Bradyrhizobiaceae bacterium]|nr:2Fe-2S iron-sulfur cluster binding domain-containing protein [Bradyrhizobiaceae bacterium]
MTTFSLTINGRPLSTEAEPRLSLADFLRDVQMLTGTHLGCEHGVCGACTVLVDNVPVRSCITYAVACDGASVTTIEGLDEDEIAKELRAAFSREHALQCGYCTPGMLISARDLVARTPAASEREIRVAMSGNLCRCTGYLGIVRAIHSVITDRRARGITALPGAGRLLLGPAGSGRGRPIAAIAPAAIAKPQEPVLLVAEDNLASWQPQATFRQNFSVEYPIDQVWQFFCDTAAVASCLPGASVSGDAAGRSVNGTMRLKVGPIKAEFHGIARIDRDPVTFAGVIEGSGRDQRSSSATRGLIRYQLVPHGSEATNIEIDVGYQLTGPLAQFSRSDLVNEIASRITSTFARNVAA